MEKGFFKKSLIWLIAMVVGMIISCIGILCDKSFYVLGLSVNPKYLEVLGLIINILATVWYAYKTWKESLIFDCGEY